MMLLKILFLLTYFILVFLTVRIFELYVSSLAGTTTNFMHYIYQYLPDVLNNIYLKTETGHPKGGSNSENRLVVENSGADTTYNAYAEEIDNTVTEFSTYGNFIENVEDTKASIWVVQVYAITQSKQLLSERKWRWLYKKLSQYGIKTAIYRCQHDPRLCLKQRIFSSAVVLSMPKGSQPKGNVVFHIYDQIERGHHTDTKEDIFQWIQSRLYPKVKTVHSMYELKEPPVTRRKYNNNISNVPSMSFIYHSRNHDPPPLVLTALSVKFTGRVKFYILKTDEKESYGITYAMTKSSTYSYGTHKGENFTYTCMELFLRTLNPEVNDFFIVSVILLNMACWLELFLQKGGPLKRILFYLWGFTMTNFLLVSIWLPVIQLLYIPQVQPLIKLCLQSFQQVMLSNIAAIIRQDFLQLSQNLHIVFIGFMCYGVFIGYLHYKFRNNQQPSHISSIMDLFDNDIQELNEIFRSVFSYMTPSLRVYRFDQHIEQILNRLSTPDLWLHSFQSNDYICDLPAWKHCEKCVEDIEFSCLSSESEVYSEAENIPDYSRCKKCHHKTTTTDPSIPSYSLCTSDCVICLDDYKCRDMMLGLPCGHCFHKYCIEEWLLSGTEGNQHRCPICRWHADIPKGKFEVIDTLE